VHAGGAGVTRLPAQLAHGGLALVLGVDGLAMIALSCDPPALPITQDVVEQRGLAGVEEAEGR
jgi:hypothetical protein